jgi:hypothetical protein
MTNPTTNPTSTDRAEQALRTYGDSPLSDGDAVLLLDDSVCLELERLAVLTEEVVDRGHAASRLIGGRPPRAVCARRVLYRSRKTSKASVRWALLVQGRA